MSQNMSTSYQGHCRLTMQDPPVITKLVIFSAWSVQCHSSALRSSHMDVKLKPRVSTTPKRRLSPLEISMQYLSIPRADEELSSVCRLGAAFTTCIPRQRDQARQVISFKPQIREALGGTILNRPKSLSRRTCCR